MYSAFDAGIDSSYVRKLVQALLRSEATAVDLSIPPRGGTDQSSGLDEHGKSHQPTFKFPLIPSDFDKNSINSQGFRRLLIRMNSNIYSVSKRFAEPTH